MFSSCQNGNAPVESGFSINKDIIIENLTENSVRALRTVYDAIKTAGGIGKVDYITKEMLSHVKLARMRYHEYLNEKKRKNLEVSKKEMEKRKATAEIEMLKKKKMKLAQQAASETTQINDMIAELSKKI